MRLNRLGALTVCGLLGSTALSSAAYAQLASPAPVRKAIDGNGVDLFKGTFNITAPVLSMGQAEPQGLSYYKLNYGSGWTDNLQGGLSLSGTTMTVRLGASSDRFTVSGSSYTNTEGNGSTLGYNGTSKIYTYTRSDGTVAHFSKTLAVGSSNEGAITDLTSPSGQKLSYGYSEPDLLQIVEARRCRQYLHADRLYLSTERHQQQLRLHDQPHPRL
jgi:hypothetical protein